MVELYIERFDSPENADEIDEAFGNILIGNDTPEYRAVLEDGERVTETADTEEAAVEAVYSLAEDRDIGLEFEDLYTQ